MFGKECVLLGVGSCKPQGRTDWSRWFLVRNVENDHDTLVGGSEDSNETAVKANGLEMTLKDWKQMRDFDSGRRKQETCVNKR